MKVTCITGMGSENITIVHLPEFTTTAVLEHMSCRWEEIQAARLDAWDDTNISLDECTPHKIITFTDHDGGKTFFIE